MKRMICRSAALLLGGMLLLSGCSKGSSKKEGFQAQLDTDTAVELDIIGYFGNFEALDQVMSDFTKVYPKITYTYQQVGGNSEEDYLKANGGVDIFMTSSELLHKDSGILADYCMDLSKEEIDLSAIDPEMLQDSKINDKQTSIPMGQNLYGMVVNTTLLEKEGLSVPEDLDSFLETLAALKEKGYTPIQGPTSKVYAELTSGIVFSGLCEGQPIQKALKEGDRSSAEAALTPAFDLLGEILEKGYTDPAINAAYPDDNYDEAILRFFEGDVPFWVCNTEKVSGMKKRESKSEAFQKEAFSYTFIYPPVGEKGQYIFREPWFGFAANKDGKHSDYALEFLRFLATKDEINQMADVKGIPSVAADPTKKEVYQQVQDAEAVKNSCINHGEVSPVMVESWYSCSNAYAAGTLSAEEAVKEYLDACEKVGASAN